MIRVIPSLNGAFEQFYFEQLVTVKYYFDQLSGTNCTVYYENPDTPIAVNQPRTGVDAKSRWYYETGGARYTQGSTDQSPPNTLYAVCKTPAGVMPLGDR